ncbi:MAG TPA: hypothetical protein VK395_22225 [Gemmataceae bacterium]|nr:hypothetical protein [Gemmataceae bacterium]
MSPEETVASLEQAQAKLQEKAQDGIPVKGVIRKQMSFDIHCGHCPRCGVTFALNDWGRHLCTCGAWLNLSGE